MAIKLTDVREELLDYLAETNRYKLPPWLLETLDSWIRSVFLGVTSFKYWDENKNKYEANANVETLRKLIVDYREFRKFVTWLDRNYKG